MIRFLKSARGILGLNARNLDYQRPMNSKSAKRIADNKLVAKKMLEQAGIAVPKTYAVITSMRELSSFDPALLPNSFVIKPNRGFGGEGILVTYNKRQSGAWLDTNLKELTWSDLKAHIQDILDGRFSLAGMPDIVFFEERLVRESLFKHLAYRGVPDIRIIVYNMVPIMAMMRIPTHASQGKANLHLGAIGVGIDIVRGVTTHAISYDRFMLDQEGARFSGLKIPDWNDVLTLAIKVQHVIGLGYVGVDIVLAKNKGPMVLEVNARPGLSIQVANLIGLKERLMRVGGLAVDSPERGIRLMKELFGNVDEAELEKSPAELYNRDDVIRIVETIEINHKDRDPQGKVTMKAKIDSGAWSSSIDYELADQIGYGNVVAYISSLDIDTPRTTDEAIELKEKIKKELQAHPDVKKVKVVKSATGSTVRVSIPICFVLKGKKIETTTSIVSREHLTYDMIIGRRDLKGFLIKPRI